MKTIQAFEYKDLPKKIKERIYDEYLKEEIEIEMDMLDNELQEGRINEEEFYDMLGCSKNYAETTSWFVPSCYYGKHEEDLRKEVNEQIEKGLFNQFGTFIQNK